MAYRRMFERVGAGVCVLIFCRFVHVFPFGFLISIKPQGFIIVFVPSLQGSFNMGFTGG